MIKLTAQCRNFATVLAALWLGLLVQHAVVRGQSAELPISELPAPNYQEKTLPADTSIAEGPVDPDGTEVLMRGPMHEAFAEVYQTEPVLPPLVPQAPPEDITELPPEVKPPGTDVQWISGYWDWDDQGEKYIWISGVWRDVPPGQTWVPGYWESADGGYRRVKGYWSTLENAQETSWLPPPPASIDYGPSYPAPADDYFYVPGNWLYYSDRYVWQPGYWCPRVDQRVFVPASYVWTNRGYIYRPAYLDYPLESRGVLFAPITFADPYYISSMYRYRPTCVIDVGLNFLVHLFIRPGRHSYWYGDWYANDYYAGHYQPWVHCHRYRNFHDPLFVYYSNHGYHHSSSNELLIDWIADKHHLCASHSQYRPAVTFDLTFHGHNRHRHNDHSGPDHDKFSYGSRYDDYIHNSERRKVEYKHVARNTGGRNTDARISGENGNRRGRDDDRRARSAADVISPRNPDRVAERNRTGDTLADHSRGGSSDNLFDRNREGISKVDRNSKSGGVAGRQSERQVLPPRSDNTTERDRTSSGRTSGLPGDRPTRPDSHNDEAERRLEEQLNRMREQTRRSTQDRNQLQRSESSIQPRGNSAQPRGNTIPPREDLTSRGNGSRQNPSDTRPSRENDRNNSIQPRGSSIQPRNNAIQPGGNTVNPARRSLPPGLISPRDNSATSRGNTFPSRNDKFQSQTTAPPSGSNAVQDRSGGRQSRDNANRSHSNPATSRNPLTQPPSNHSQQIQDRPRQLTPQRIDGGSSGGDSKPPAFNGNRGDRGGDNAGNNRGSGGNNRGSDGSNRADNKPPALGGNGGNRGGDSAGNNRDSGGNHRSGGDNNRGSGDNKRGGK